MPLEHHVTRSWVVIHNIHVSEPHVTLSLVGYKPCNSPYELSLTTRTPCNDCPWLLHTTGVPYNGRPGLLYTIVTPCNSIGEKISRRYHVAFCVCPSWVVPLVAIQRPIDQGMSTPVSQYTMLSGMPTLGGYIKQKHHYNASPGRLYTTFPPYNAHNGFYAT